MPAELDLPNATSLSDKTDSMYTNGFAYFPNALSPEHVRNLRSAIDNLEPLNNGFDFIDTPDNGGFYNKTVYNIFNHNPVFRDLLDVPEIIDLAETIHGTDCHIIGMTAWVTGPGRPDQHLHCDWLPVELPEDVVSDDRVKMPIFASTAHFYLNDMYEDLGPTKFVPGSHLSGRLPGNDTIWKGEPEKSVICKAGDALTFRSEIWHRGSSNKSSENRYLIQVHYSKRMVTQKFPPYLNEFQFDPKIIDTSTNRQKRLLGKHRRSSYD